MYHTSALPIGVRKSSSDCTMSVGVFTFFTNRIGERLSYMAWFSHGLPKNSFSVSPCTSDAPHQYVHSLIMRSVSAALKRVV
jgi:hypothetical protein